jgi:hypothetical protein
MEAKEEVFTSLSPCSRPPILMGDDTPVTIAGEGRVDSTLVGLRMFCMFQRLL